jgi:hypothetical protein
MKCVDRLLERVAADEPHGVKWAAAGVGTEPIDRHDAGVFQPAGDLGLEQEPLAAHAVVGVIVEDLLEGDLAVQLGIQRHEDGAQSAPGVGAEDAEPLAVAGSRAHGISGRAVGVGGGAGVEVGRTRADMGQRGIELAVSDPGQALACGLADADGGEAPLGIAAMTPEMFDDESLQEGQAVGLHGVLLGQDLSHRSVPGLGPGVEGGHELGLVDQPGLQREQAEE